MRVKMKLVEEVAFIRPILILLLVVYHAFLIYGGGWAQPVGYVDIPMYRDIAVLSYSCMLETFVFISGYLFFWGILNANKSYNLKSILKSKFQRLLIPAWVWSCLYFFIIDNSNSLKDIILMGGGIGHMWFLPMLFWCFIFAWGFLNLPCSYKVKLALSMTLAIISWLPIPFRIGMALYYQLFFILGFFLVQKRELILKYLTPLRLSYLWLVNIIVLILYIAYGDVLNQLPKETLQEKVIFYSMSNVGRLIVSFIGVVSLYSTALYYIRNHALSDWIIKFGACCFGVYIFQQFILKIIYYQTSLPAEVGPYCLPWLSVIITLITSWLLTVIMRRYRLFRKIL